MEDDGAWGMCRPGNHHKYYPLQYTTFVLKALSLPLFKAIGNAVSDW